MDDDGPDLQHREEHRQPEISSIRTSNATGIPNVVLDLPLG